MVGSWVVEVLDVKPFTIHGDLYYELQVKRLEDDGGRTLVVRVPRHAAKAEPLRGQRMEMTFLMGQVTGATVVAR